jgi:signal transduction histidine kinase/CheY-like chemotaxis protein/PAS domain-containing protein
MEYTLSKKNGEKVHFLSASETIRDEDGCPIYVAGTMIDVTELKNLIDEAGLQLLKLDMVLKATKISLWDMYVSGDSVTTESEVIFSDDFRRMLGYENKADFPNVLGSWSDLLHPEDKEKAVDAFTNHVLDKTGGTPFDVDYRMLKKNGEYGYFHAAGETLRDAAGNPLQVSGGLIDTTPLKTLINEAELQLLKLNLMMKAGKILMWEMDVIKEDPANLNHPVTWPDEFRHLLGYKDESDFPNTVGALFSNMHPDDMKWVPNAAVSHILDKTGKIPYNVEYRLIRKDGGIVHIHATGETTRDEEGNPLRTVGTIVDITESRSLLDTMKNILNNLDLNIYVSDTKTDELLFVNDAMRKQYDIEGDGVGQICYKVFQDGFDERCDFCPCHQLDKDPGKTVVWEEHSDVTGRIYRNTDRYINWIDGRLVHMQHSVDITELVNAKEQAEKQRLEAETANKAKSEFLSHISHEIRTPMNAVLGTAEIYIQKETNSPDVDEAFNTIYSSGNLLLNIINDILDLSKIEAGKLELMAAAYDIPSIIYDTVQLNLLRYESKPIEFDLKIDENTPLNFYGDELRIKQILNNIISNAFKYTERGKVELSVSAEAKNGDEFILVLRVSDTGQGMTKTQIYKLFDEYTRFNMDANRTIVGTGLGMHITKRLVDAMNGEILVESELDKGSVFTVRLPQIRVDSDVCGAELASKLCGSRFKSMIKLSRAQIIHEFMPYGSVLIVDDVESNLYVAKGMLMPYGMKIDTAASGFEAVEKVKSGNEYNLIFMDHMMPKMNGIEATKIIRDAGYNSAVVALTANAVSGSSELFLSNGFDGYITKPIDIRELNAVLNRFIRDKQPLDVIEAAREEVGSPKEVDDDLAAAVMLDIKNSLPMLENIPSSGDIDLELFTTTAHGLKSALYNIGETELSRMALMLEKAGDDKEIAAIQTEMPAFITALQSLLEKLRQRELKSIAPVNIPEDDMVLLREKLGEIIKACEAFDKKAAKTALDELKQKTWPYEINSALDEIAACLLRGEFKKIVSVAEKI